MIVVLRWEYHCPVQSDPAGSCRRLTLGRLTLLNERGETTMKASEVAIDILGMDLQPFTLWINEIRFAILFHPCKTARKFLHRIIRI